MQTMQLSDSEAVKARPNAVFKQHCSIDIVPTSSPTLQSVVALHVPRVWEPETTKEGSILKTHTN